MLTRGAFAESFIKTLKAEKVDCNKYETLEGAQADSRHFLAFIYNGKRLHSALGYRTPEEFEAAFAAERTATASSEAAQVGDARRSGQPTLSTTHSPAIQMRGRTATWIF